MIQSELRDIIETTIRRELAPVPISDVSIEERVDQDQVESLYVTVHLPATTEPLPGAKLLGAMAAVNAAVLACGEDRFPYLRTRRLDNPLPA